MDSILKLIYDNPYIDDNGHATYFLNGVHPEVIKYLYLGISQGKSVNSIIHDIQTQNSSSDWSCFFRHSNFLSYYRRQAGIKNFIKINDIKDDSNIYVWPIEIGGSIDIIPQTINLTLGNTKHEYTFIDTIDPVLLQHIRQGKVKIMFNMIHDPLWNGHALYNVEQYFINNGIDPSNITIVAGNSFDEYYKNFPDAKMKITHGYIMVQQAGDRLDHFPYVSSLGYVSDAVRETDLDKNTIRPKRFLCWNRTMRIQRVWLGYLAQKYNLLENSYFSFLNFPGGGLHTIENQIQHYAGKEEALKYGKKFFDIIPYDLDTHHLEANQKSGFSTNNNKKEFYLNSYVHITSETVFAEDISCPFFSEKTFHAMVNLQPFIYVGCAGALKQLKNWNIKTFHPFIDESYDDEQDPVKRFRLIEQEIKKINDMSMQELHDWYYSITDTLLHNQQALRQFSPVHPFENAVNDIIKFYR